MKLQIESVFIGMCIGLLIGVGLSLLMVKESTEELKRLQQMENVK